jgi:hypothetical protein
MGAARKVARADTMKESSNHAVHLLFMSPHNPGNVVLSRAWARLLI